MKLRHIRDLDVNNKRVLVRVDFNLNFSSKKHLRLQSVLPTLKYLLKQNATLILLSHKGRPKSPNHRYSLAALVPILNRYLNKKVRFIESFSADTIRQVSSLPLGSVILLENLRFTESEENNNPVFAKQLAMMGHAYVNDAFSMSHRTHASMVGITQYLPSYAGFQLEKEVIEVTRFLKNYQNPLLVVVGGNKTQEKMRLIKSFLTRADFIYVGGAISTTFLGALGQNVGKSVQDKHMYKLAKTILLNARKNGKRIYLPQDARVLQGKKSTATTLKKLQSNMQIMDIGSASVRELEGLIKKSKTIFWNGPLGVYENPLFRKSTISIVNFLIKHKKRVLLGGGDTITAVGNIEDFKFIYVSTGGGALFEFILKGTLPALEPLRADR